MVQPRVIPLTAPRPHVAYLQVLGSHPATTPVITLSATQNIVQLTEGNLMLLSPLQLLLPALTQGGGAGWHTVVRVSMAAICSWGQRPPHRCGPSYLEVWQPWLSPFPIPTSLIFHLDRKKSSSHEVKHCVADKREPCAPILLPYMLVQDEP